jgi:HAE1 family hydrophobic/amphiphilic exporter-1
VVSGIRETLKHLLDVPKTLVTSVVFDQSVFVKTAISNLGSEGGIGLVLTALMILVFLGNGRATVAVMLSIPLSALAAFLILNMMGQTINSIASRRCKQITYVESVVQFPYKIRHKKPGP